MPILCVTCLLGDTVTEVPGIGTAEVRKLLPKVGEVIAEIGPSIQLAPSAWLDGRA